jgi:hypothetical protein
MYIISSNNTINSKDIKMENYFIYFIFIISLAIFLFSLSFLIFSLIKRGLIAEYKIPPILQILRFICISGITISPIIFFMLADIGTGINLPFGLVIQQEYRENSQQNNLKSIQWNIYIGGSQNDNYATGISFPFYVFELGLIGGYLRYLYEISKKKDDTMRDDKHIDKFLYGDNKKINYLQRTLTELIGIMISPLLGIAIYFVLFRANPSINVYVPAIMSITLGLITKDIANCLIVFVKFVVSNKEKKL